MLPCLLTCLALLFSLGGLAQGKPPAEPAQGVEENQEVLLLEAVKTGMLRALGMDGEPTLTERASRRDLRRMFQLYRERLRELKGNSSHSVRRTSTVLLPAAVVPLKVFHNAEHHIQWYRAVFQTNPDIRSERTLARADLTISREVAAENQPEIRQGLQVRVDGMSIMNITAQRDPLVPTGVSGAHRLTVDIRPWVEMWKRNPEGRSLVVDVGWTVGKNPSVLPGLALAIGLSEPRPARRGRRAGSDQEDDCSAQGRCCRRAVAVTFQALGWADWVVAPAGYTMRYCDGLCPHNHRPASMHAQVKSRLHQITKGGTPRPCCVPAAYEPMILMHYDSGGQLRLTPFNDLIVSKCHCA